MARIPYGIISLLLLCFSVLFFQFAHAEPIANTVFLPVVSNNSSTTITPTEPIQHIELFKPVDSRDAKVWIETNPAFSVITETAESLVFSDTQQSYDMWRYPESDMVPSYATFQSHNPKVLENQNGIFITYLKSYITNPPITPQPGGDQFHSWVLMRSVDHGLTFSTIYFDINTQKPPAMVSDKDGNLYLILSALGDGNCARYFIFKAENNYQNPEKKSICAGAGTKFTLHYDEISHKLYYATSHIAVDPTGHWTVSSFARFDPDGNNLSYTYLTTAGTHASLEYPFFTMSGSTLYHAWTTQELTKYLYWDIHFIVSNDGGSTWKTPNGDVLTPPIVSDSDGTTTQIVLPDEFDYHTFLASVLYHGNALHFMYLAQVPQTPRMHYVRYNLATNERDIDIYPTWKGTNVSLGSLDGFFVSDDVTGNNYLYL